MHLLTLGVNHSTAPLSLRDKMAFVPEEVSATIARLRSELASADRGALTEAAIVSTCNRTEVYCTVAEPELASGALTQFIAHAKQVPAEQIRPAIYARPQSDAVRHAFRVASGLDSMVLGEPQILGQMKQAERLARAAGGLGLMLHHLFQSTFSVAKEVRSQTEIGAQSVSMAAAGVRVAERIFGALTDSAILFVGAGEMIELTATHFAGRQPRAIAVANRTLERAHQLASRFHGNALRLADLPEHIAHYDIIVSCTASSLPIIGLGMIERAIKARRHRPIFILDLAVPRDVEPEVARLNDVYLYTVDDLGRMIADGSQSRLAAVAQAEAIIENRVRDFEAWQRTRHAVPVIQGLRQRADAIRDLEVQRALKLLARGGSGEEALQQLALALTNKFLHAPLAALHDANAAADPARQQIIDALTRFYQSNE